MDDQNQIPQPNQLEEINIDNLKYSDAAKYFEAATFITQPFVETTNTSWGTRAVWTPQGLPYMGTELRFEEGKGTDEQISDRFRIFVFRDGRATIQIEDEAGNMVRKQMETGLGYSIEKGQRYAIHAENVSRILEAAMATPDDGQVHREKFQSQEYVVRIGKPWGYELHFGKEGDPLMAKILHINEGDRLSEKAHRIKTESYWMLSGTCNMIMENSNRELVNFPLEYDKGYTTNVGQRHRQQGATDCEVFEVSTPERGKTWRIQDDYERPDETDEQRKLERGQL